MTSESNDEYLLDTSFLIDLLNGHPDAVELHETIRGSESTSTVCVYELTKFEGFSSDCLDGKSVLRLTLGDVRSSGSIYRSLKEDGEKIGETDTLIGGVARSRGMCLVTRDRDFEKIDSLETEYYSSG
ncbi:type II toxin-antitoxin system VapC family toxin [Halorutilales archaeon Cl-col2-1]